MKPAPPEPSDLVLRLRQQLILAQVRIMELEDVRDTLAPRLAELEQRLQAAQTLADGKTGEAAHLEKVLAAARIQWEQVRQLQQLTGEELAAARAAAADAGTTLHQRSETVARLEAELRAVKSSRSWRWTAWLRALGGRP